MLNSQTIKSIRRGKAAETFNILRGLRFKRSQGGLKFTRPQDEQRFVLMIYFSDTMHKRRKYRPEKMAFLAGE